MLDDASPVSRQRSVRRSTCASASTPARPSPASSASASSAFDVWGTTVNIASRMESLGEPGRVHVSEAVADALAGQFSFTGRGLIDVKGAGAMRTFFLGDPV